MKSEKELVGIDAILECKILGVVSLATLLDWRIHYALPVYKVNGVYVATRADLHEWKKQHRDLTDVPKIIQRKEKNPPRARLWRFF